MKYKIVERFVSTQGEGFWTGTSMAFVRLAQCPVGKAPGICKAWDSREFICDTGESYKGKSDTEWHPYTHVNEELTATEIVEWATNEGQKRVCVTGGEPLIYDLTELIQRATNRGYSVHIETSGTEALSEIFKLHGYLYWLTVSPKHSYLEDVLKWTSELKVLVDAQTDFEDLLKRFNGINSWKFVQPIEDASLALTKDNTIVASQFVRQHPNWRLSLQTHKYLGVR